MGVQTARADTQSLSFEVPLYMTVAVVNGAGGDAEVLCPTTYSIRNLSAGADGNSVPVAVTGMAVETAAGGTWSLRSAAPTNAKEISLSIGGAQLPDVNQGAGGQTPVDLKAADSKFYDFAAGKYRPISAQPGGTALFLDGKVAPGTSITAEEGPSPQFRCVYTVSLLDTDGNPIGAFYDGPGEGAAATP